VAHVLLRRIGIHSWYRSRAEEALVALGVSEPARTIDDLVWGGMPTVAPEDDGEEALEVTTSAAP
jgi:hypothetical protein